MPGWLLFVCVLVWFLVGACVGYLVGRARYKVKVGDLVLRKGMRLGFGVEGMSVRSADGRITKAHIRSVAVTPNPKNPDAVFDWSGGAGPKWRRDDE